MPDKIDTSTTNTLRQRYADLQPGRILDTRVELGPGTADVLLSNGAAQQIRHGLSANPEAAWQRLIDSDLGLVEKSVARRALGELALIGFAVDQVEGDIDRSKEIADLEATLYSHYNPAVFRAAVKRKIQKIESLNLPGDLEPARAMLLDTFDSIVGDDAGEVVDLEEPNEASLSVMNTWLTARYAHVLTKLDANPERMYDSSEIAQHFEFCIESTPALRDMGWKAGVFEREKLAISTSAASRLIIVPARRKASAEALGMLDIHELFGHALRAANAEMSGDETGSIGTATYDQFEESFMIALEQCLSKKFNPDRGVDHYIAVGLSVTEHLSKDEIATIFQSIHQLQKAKGGINSETVNAANNSSSVQIRRVFTGMTDVDDGIAHRKDIDYLHGLNNSWALIDFMAENHCVDEVMSWILSAKFNPFNEDDREHVEQYHPMPGILHDFFASR